MQNEIDVSNMYTAAYKKHTAALNIFNLFISRKSFDYCFFLVWKQVELNAVMVGKL